MQFNFVKLILLYIAENNLNGSVLQGMVCVAKANLLAYPMTLGSSFSCNTIQYAEAEKEHQERSHFQVLRLVFVSVRTSPIMSGYFRTLYQARAAV